MTGAPSIAIIGGTFWGNRGAESMMSTVIGMVRRDFPTAKFYVFSYYPVRDSELVQDENIYILSATPFSLVVNHFLASLVGKFHKLFHQKLPKSRSFKTVCILEQSDLLLDIGGITFSDGREKFLPFNILTIWPAMIIGTPVVKMAQALGPFKNSINRLCAQYFLKRCKHIFARGQKTFENLLDLHIQSSKYSETADVAFLYENAYSLTKENENKVNVLSQKLSSLRAKGEKIIVISPSTVVQNQSIKKGRDYLGELIKIVSAFSSDSHIVVIPNATREGSEKKHNNDLITIRQMQFKYEKENKNSEHVDWVAYDVNTLGLRNIITEANILITSRYHAMISGLSLGIPTLVIGWGHKYRETLEMFDLKEYAVDYKDFEDDLTSVIREILSSEKKINQVILQHLPEVKKRSHNQFEYLMKALQ